jgi:hypothetical protein
MGGAEGIVRACGPKPPVLCVRPRVLKPPSSSVYWLSDSGELSYELEYAAGGPGGGRPVEFMPVS